jgi:mRNA-degrading endonuclease RelE of RelBE toxin-antitoxin system
MPNELPDHPASGLHVEIRYTPEFKRNLRALAKRYRAIRDDIQSLLSQLQSGESPGDHVPRTGYPIYKVRVRNSDVRKGKRAGYRLIYYWQTPTKVILITIYSKSDQSDVSADEIRRIIREFEASVP